MEDCQKCAARISRQSDYWWWLRTASKRAEQAAEMLTPRDMLVPADFAVAIFGALQWPGAIKVDRSASEYADMTRLTFEPRPPDPLWSPLLRGTGSGE